VRILFDAFWWTVGPHSNRQVLREFVRAWAAEHPEDEIVLAVRRGAARDAARDAPAGAQIVEARLRPQGLVAILELPRIARRVGADAIVAHNFTPRSGRSLVFVHDLMFETSPQWFGRAELAYFSLMTRTLHRAAVVATSSRAEAERIARVAPRAGRVLPVGLALPPGMAAGVERRPGWLPERAASFLLVVGRLNVRKNLELAIEAAIDSGRATSERPLVIVGERSGVATTLSDRARAAIASGAVLVPGFIADDELVWLYRRTALFLFPSLDEGFGIPLIEAIAFGAPILASDIAVFREIAGDRASYADPLDRTAWSESIARLVDAGARPEPADPESLGYSWPLAARRLRAALAATIDADEPPRSAQ
jgi:glycosyltransferase involved in cell wall biosynthesis